MTTQRRFIGLIICVAVLINLVVFPKLSWAVELQGSQPIEKTATLVGPKARAPIPLYLRPAPNQPNVGYGVNGDSVTVMEQLASFLPEADQSTAWNHIRLDNEPYTEGWVQGKFLLILDDEIQEDE